jgi:hypothetical protein
MHGVAAGRWFQRCSAAASGRKKRSKAEEPKAFFAALLRDNGKVSRTLGPSEHRGRGRGVEAG